MLILKSISNTLTVKMFKTFLLSDVFWSDFGHVDFEDKDSESYCAEVSRSNRNVMVETIVHFKCEPVDCEIKVDL